MKIYRLSIVDQKSHHLEASTTKEDIWVRADSEDQARDLAGDEFCIATEPHIGEDTKFCPWRHADVSSCIEITDSTYSIDGPPQILNTNV
jgi:hypothetical protein